MNGSSGERQVPPDTLDPDWCTVYAAKVNPKGRLGGGRFLTLVVAD